MVEVQVSDFILLSRKSGQLQTVGSSGGIKNLDETEWILGADLGGHASHPSFISSQIIGREACRGNNTNMRL